MTAPRTQLERITRALRGESVPWPAETDWDEVIAVAERHGVLVMLSRKVASEPLLAAARPLTERAFVLTRQLRMLVNELTSAGIEVLPIKGPVLAATAYGDPAMRGASGDLDLVVRQRDFEPAIARLLAAGYTRHEGAIDDHDHEQWESEAHLLPSFLPATMVELHTDLIGNFHTAPVDLDAVLSRCRTMTLFGVPMRVTAAEDLLLYLCLHGSRHLWSRLLWVCDIDALIRAESQLDWDALLERAAAIDATRRVTLGVHLAHTLLGTPLPSWFSARRSLRVTAALVRRRMEATSAGVREPNLAMRFASEMAARETLAQRVTYVKKQLAPNARDRAWIALPRRLEWMRIVLRPIRVLTSYGQGIRGRRDG